MSIINAFPTTLVNGQVADATVVMSLFNWIQSQTNANALSNTVAPGGVNVPNFTIDHSTPNGRVVIANTNPAGWNTGTGRMTVEFTVTPTGYFAANPNGHFAIVLRQDPALVATAVRGQGIAIGNATGFSPPSDINPTPIIESWFNGFGAGNALWPTSARPRSLVMSDGHVYKFIVDSSKIATGDRYIRYRMYELAGGFAYLWVDTGDVLDAVNTYADLTQSALMFGQVFESNLSTWSLPFTNVNVFWGPAENPSTDDTSRVSIYGSEQQGSINFPNLGSSILAPANAGPSLVNSLAFQSSTANTATTVVVKPNGSSTTANTLYSNNSASSATYQAITFGMAGAVGLLETLGYTAANPVFGINIGSGNRVATFTTTGMRLLNGTVDIGVPINYSAGLTVFGGTNAVTFDTTATLNVDTICGIGYITSFLGGSYSPGTIENAVRPLWCLVSGLIADLKAKKVI